MEGDLAIVDRLIFDEGTCWGRSRSHSGGTRAAQMMHPLAREDIRLLCEKVGHVRSFLRNARGGEGEGMCGFKGHSMTSSIPLKE